MSQSWMEGFWVVIMYFIHPALQRQEIGVIINTVQRFQVSQKQTLWNRTNLEEAMFVAMIVVSLKMKYTENLTVNLYFLCPNIQISSLGISTLLFLK